MGKFLHKMPAILLACALCSGTVPVLAQDIASTQAFHSASENNQAFAQSIQNGDWLWIDSSTGILDNGIDHIFAPANDYGVVYAAGRGFLARSSDNGITWHIVLTFNADGITTGELDPEELGDENADISESQRIDTLRNYLQTELSSQFGDEYAEYLLENITDSEIELAEDADAIEALSNINLSMDTDLNAVYESDRETDNTIYAALLHGETTFAGRIAALKNGGMSEEMAIIYAASPDMVWKIQTTQTSGELFIATSDAIYHSTDRGNTWRTAFSADGHDKILSLATTYNDSQIIAGLTDGIAVSHDHGRTWTAMHGMLNGAVYNLWGDKNTGTVIAQTTAGLFLSADSGISWSPFQSTDFSSSNIRDVSFGKVKNTIVVLSDNGIFTTRNAGKNWASISTDILDEPRITRISALDEDLTQFVIAAPHDVYFYHKGTWLTASNGLLGQEIYDLSADGNADGSVWLATNIGAFRGNPWEKNTELSQKIRDLQRQWAAEPDPYTIVNRALIANGLSTIQEERFVMRAGLSFLLPKVTAQYKFYENRDDKFLRKGGLTNVDYSQNHLEQLLMEGITLDLDDIDGRNLMYDHYIRTFRHEWSIYALWELGYNKFRAGENSARKEARFFRAARTRLTKDVLKLYLKRQSLQMKAFSAKPVKNKKSKAAIKKEINQTLQLAEIENKLSILTGGFYGVAIEAAKKQ